MTREHRMLVGLMDIKAVTLECRSCHARLTVSPDSVEMKALLRCPMCGAQWLSGEYHHREIASSDLMLFLLQMRDARKAQSATTDTAVGVHVLFEFDVPEELRMSMQPKA